MPNHPRRNWRRRWRVDLRTHEARHESGLVVRFRRDDQGWLGDMVGEYPRTLSMLDAARYMREAGEMYERAVEAEP